MLKYIECNPNFTKIPTKVDRMQPKILVQCLAKEVKIYEIW